MTERKNEQKLEPPTAEPNKNRQETNSYETKTLKDKDLRPFKNKKLEQIDMNNLDEMEE